MESTGYYYYDTHYELQGPFTAEQLASWQEFLPDNLTIHTLNSHGQWEQGMCFRLLHILLQAEVRLLSLLLAFFKFQCLGRMYGVTNRACLSLSLVCKA